ncbi:MAG: hypothetical protein OXI15_14040 [Chromatiales bacterium]|nr:hypothetical protein [Chromatiales bacterium]
MFDPSKLYRCNDPAIQALAPYSTLAHMRSEGRGPAFLKIGGKVLYRGSDLNDWLDSITVRPKASHREAAPA